MGVNFSLMLYTPAFIMYARPVTYYPITSQPGAPAMYTRGVFHSDQIDVPLEDGSVFVDQRTSLDVLIDDFGALALPQQLDQVYVPEDNDLGPKGVVFEVVSVTDNAGGVLNLALRKLADSLPP